MVDAKCYVVISLLLLPVGCRAGISDRNLSYITPSDAAILMEEGSASLLGANKATILVDPRPTLKFRDAHIRGAVNIPFGRLRLHSWMLDDAGTIIVAGDTYNDSAAIAMSKALMKLGFEDVKTLHGGLVGWEDAGEPVETAE